MMWQACICLDAHRSLSGILLLCDACLEEQRAGDPGGQKYVIGRDCVSALRFSLHYHDLSAAVRLHCFAAGWRACVQRTNQQPTACTSGGSWRACACMPAPRRMGICDLEH